MTNRVTRYSEGSLYGGTTGDGWAFEHNFRTEVSRAWKLLPNGNADISFEDLVAEGDGHDHAIFDLIAEQIIADRRGGGGAGSFFLMFPAMLIAIVLSAVVWWAYSAMGAP